jgi:hypothetical protein
VHRHSDFQWSTHDDHRLLWMCKPPELRCHRHGRLGGRLKDAQSALTDMHGRWKSMRESIGEPRHAAEFQVCFEANAFSKNSRVAEAWRSQLTEATD